MNEKRERPVTYEHVGDGLMVVNGSLEDIRAHVKEINAAIRITFEDEMRSRIERRKERSS